MSGLSGNRPMRTTFEILLVDDNPADIRLTREALRESGFDSHIAVVNDGVEAMAFLNRSGKYSEEARPDLILLDLNMPRMNGQEVLAELKASDEFKTIPVCILTTSSAATDIHNA